MKKKSEGNIRKGLFGMLDMPLGRGYDGVRIEILGDSEAIVSGCRGVSEYHPEKVILKLKRQYLHIGGRHLDCITYFDKTVEVKGRIESLLFCADAIVNGEEQ